MRLKSKYDAPVGGWYFVMPDETILKANNPGLDALERRVVNYMHGNSMKIPDNLKDVIEEQICQRQPKDRCIYTKGLGDQLSLVIHKVAGVIDMAIGTKLEKKARGCRTCGQRRVTLNSLSK